jgi:hypothetical protein
VASPRIEIELVMRARTIIAETRSTMMHERARLAAMLATSRFPRWGLTVCSMLAAQSPSTVGRIRVPISVGIVLATAPWQST